MKFKPHIYKRNVLIACAIFLLVSCGRKTDPLDHLPKEACIVVAVDVKSIALKSIDIHQLLTIENLRKLAGRAGGSKDSIAESIANSGLDFTGTAYAFGEMQEDHSYGAIVARLSDAEKFEKFLKRANKSAVITEVEGIKFALTGSTKNIVGWTGDAVYFVFGDALPRQRVRSLVDLKKEETLSAASESFRAAKSDGGDIFMWADVQTLSQSMRQYRKNFQLMDLTDTYLSMSCNFESGKIVLDAKYTTNYTAARSRITKRKVATAIVALLPGDSLVGLAGFGFNMQKMYLQLDKQRLTNRLESSLSTSTVLSLEQVLRMFSGDVAFAVNGIKMKEELVKDPKSGQSRWIKQPVPDFSAVFGIADKERMYKLLDELVSNKVLTKQGSCYSFRDKFFIFEKGPTAILTTSVARMNSFNNVIRKKINPELTAMLESNSVSFFVSPPAIPVDIYSTAHEVARDNIKNSEINSIYFTSTGVTDNRSEGKLVIKFKNEKENALVTIQRVSKSIKVMLEKLSKDSTRLTTNIL